MFYHKLDKLAELIKGDLATKIWRGIFYKDLTDRECNCSLPSKVNGNCVYEGKSRSNGLIYEVKLSVCDAIYIGNTQQTPKKQEWTDISPISHVYSRTDKNKNHFLPIPNSTLILLRHVQIYVSIRRLK